ncbi:hypothetical protein GC176_04145 [bacterium]|nr:hypothetical protein [bacterium]
MGASGSRSEMTGLLSSLWDGGITAEQLARLQLLLRDNPGAQHEYLKSLDLHLGLKHLVTAEVATDASAIPGLETSSPAATRLITLRHRAVTVVAATLAITASLIAVLLLGTPEELNRQQEVMSIVQSDGVIRIRPVDGESRTATAGMQVFPGERLETEGRGSATLTFEDGTRLTIVNGGSLSLVPGNRKSIMLHRGIVSAAVARQPAGHPMLLATPRARVDVLGTRFAISASREATELNVSEGRVRVTRVSDGRTVEVRQGQGVVTRGDVELTVSESARPREVWEVSFEDGVPPGWTGAATAEHLPAGSRGAIRTVGDTTSTPLVYVIASRDEWVEGLFAIDEDTHLHITMKMEHPDWLNVFLSTRRPDATDPTWTLHNFNEVPFWPPRPGQWQTLTIPLTEFRRKRDGVFQHEPPVTGGVAYSLSISATEPDRGLVIDRIWTTRGGPGEVQSVPLP